MCYVHVLTYLNQLQEYKFPYNSELTSISLGACNRAVPTEAFNSTLFSKIGDEGVSISMSTAARYSSGGPTTARKQHIYNSWKWAKSAKT